MDIFAILFWLLTVMAISCALGVILSRNPINSVLFLSAMIGAMVIGKKETSIVAGKNPHQN